MTPPETGSSAMAASPARSSSRGQQECSGKESDPVALLTLEAPVPDAVAEIAKTQEVPAS